MHRFQYFCTKINIFQFHFCECFEIYIFTYLLMNMYNGMHYFCYCVKVAVIS